VPFFDRFLPPPDVIPTAVEGSLFLFCPCPLREFAFVAPGFSPASLLLFFPLLVSAF